MSKPVIAQRFPCSVEVTEGKSYWWCSCGRSASQPFCDGSHAGTDFTPLEYVAKRTRTLSLCACKYTGKPPYCDNAHRDLP